MVVLKKPSVKQLGKYTTENLEYYGNYLLGVRLIMWEHLKFIDESSFESRSLQRKFCLSPKGTNRTIVRSDLQEKTLKLILMTNLNPEFPVSTSITDTTNDQWGPSWKLSQRLWSKEF